MEAQAGTEIKLSDSEAELAEAQAYPVKLADHAV